ncbi:carbohydrate ABC transporter permease [Georgenia subflava]|uniref:ABC transporter permease subunit n=1 Tax=Georgenia subflava TaxID=1622177 RepID=A0A6N7EG13_9MICO|nr:sugar ABC transporter permease [Georgenia subflava]MPV35615.1 ABC transporter permease subunit [Georgenia subflava]
MTLTQDRASRQRDKLSSGAARPGRPRSVGAARRRHNAMTGLLFVLPMLTLFIVFRYVPVLGAIGMSFTDFDIAGNWEPIGAENYRRLATDPLFWQSLRATVLYSAIFVPTIIVVSLVVALLLNRLLWRPGLFRGALFIPYVTSFVMASIVWGWLFKIDGLINAFLELFGIGPLGFLQDSRLVLASLATVATWKGFAYSMLILLAGLKGISPEILEASRIDGANRWQEFWRITLPLLKPVLLFVVVIETIMAFQTFDTVYVMTGGGPVNASYVLVYMLYDQAFVFLDFGYAATIGIALFVIVLAISLIQRLVLDRSNK